MSKKYLNGQVFGTKEFGGVSYYYVKYRSGITTDWELEGEYLEYPEHTYLKFINTTITFNV